jgi:hypothetical protein
VTIGRLVTWLGAALAAEARAVALVLERNELTVISLRVDVVKAGGSAELGRVRRMIGVEQRALEFCIQRAMFVNPDLASPIRIPAAVIKGGAVRPTLPTEREPHLARCLDPLFASLQVPRAAGPGSFELELHVRRQSADSIRRPGSPFPSLTGAGDISAPD